MKNRTVLLLWLDCSLLLVVVVLECLSLTGLRLHEWLGFLLCPLVLLHVVLQWQWFVTQFQRVLTPGARRVRVNASLNLLLLIMMAGVLVSGGLVSNQSVATLGERFGRLRLWSEIHGGLNFVLVVLVGLHLALNWDWILAALRRRQTTRPGLVTSASLRDSLSPRERAGLPSVVLLTKEGVRGKGPFASPPFTNLSVASINRRFMGSLCVRGHCKPRHQFTLYVSPPS
jgi:hypothetical protein